MAELTEIQRRLLLAALRARGSITVIETESGDTSVRAGSERICDSAAPIEPLASVQLVELAGKREDLSATFPGSEIERVLLYQLTPAGRGVAQELEIEARGTDGGLAGVASSPVEPDA